MNEHDLTHKLLTEQAMIRDLLASYGVEYPMWLTLEELRDKVMREKVRRTIEGWDLNG